jgi:hypothetical protein
MVGCVIFIVGLAANFLNRFLLKNPTLDMVQLVCVVAGLVMLFVALILNRAPKSNQGHAV